MIFSGKRLLRFPVGPILTLSLVLAGVLGAHAQVGSKPEPAALEMCLSDVTRAKPPLRYLDFNITVRNRARRPRWFIFPAALYEKPSQSPAQGGIDGVEVYSSPSGGEIKVVDFSGTFRSQPESAGGFKGILLPAGDRVSIRDFRIRYWGEAQSPQLVFRIVMADDVFLAGTPAGKWMGVDLRTRKSGPVNEKQLQADYSQYTKDRGELAVEFKAPEELVIEIASGTQCAGR